MITKIYKYNIPAIGKSVTIQMPKYAHICDVNNQGNELYMWAMVDIQNVLEENQFIVYGTGWDISDIDNLYFLKTVHMPDGLVWHVFSIINMQ